MIQSSESSESSGSSGDCSIVFRKWCSGQWMMVMRGVEAVGCRDDFASVEHALKHLFHKCMFLTGRVEVHRVGTSPTPTMDGDVVFAFMVGGGVVCFHWFVRPVKEG